jgi:RNA-directed DNA polymerase
VQAALKIVLEPVSGADFLPCSFGFRPRRSPVAKDFQIVFFTSIIIG